MLINKGLLGSIEASSAKITQCGPCCVVVEEAKKILSAFPKSVVSENTRAVSVLSYRDFCGETHINDRSYLKFFFVCE